MPTTANAFAALERDGKLTPWSYQQRDARPHDVRIDVLYCGVCHTDVHQIGPWGRHFPVVPGHETVGRVVEIGAAVTTHAVGDLVAVGPVVDSCRECPPCLAGDETLCLTIATSAYGAEDRHGDGVTRGGFADRIIVDEHFVYRLPDGLDPAAAAPLLCAGSTVFAPLRHWGAGPGTTVGIVGIGGLGHLGVKFARALGAHVVAFTTTAAKAADARRLGAHEVVLAGDAAQPVNRLDLIIDTVPAVHPMTPLVQALRTDGTLVTVGLPDTLDVATFAMAVGRKSIAGAGAGGTRVTREMLEFAAAHDITADIELLGTGDLNTALARVAANDVKYRFVIDLKR